MHRLTILLALALTCACASTPPPPSNPYNTVRVRPFTPETSSRACPTGYRVLWSETCPSVRDASEALLLCND